jgi:hypothetical protein
MIPNRIIQLAVLCLAMGAAHAEEEYAPTHIARRGKLLLNEDLSKAPANLVADLPLTKMKSGWKLWSGRWEFKDGVMHGTQLASDGRGAVAACVLPLRNAIFQFEVRLDDCKQVHFRLQDSIPEHICRVIVSKTGFSARKDDHDHGGPDVDVPFGKESIPIDPSEWKTVLVEILGKQMAATIDGHTITGSHPLIASPKAFFDFVVSGGSASFRNVRVWDAVAKDAK